MIELAQNMVRDLLHIDLRGSGRWAKADGVVRWAARHRYRGTASVGGGRLDRFHRNLREDARSGRHTVFDPLRPLDHPLHRHMCPKPRNIVRQRCSGTVRRPMAGGKSGS